MGFLTLYFHCKDFNWSKWESIQSGLLDTCASGSVLWLWVCSSVRLSVSLLLVYNCPFTDGSLFVCALLLVTFFFWNFTLSLNFVHVAICPCYFFLTLHFFRVAFFSCSTFLCCIFFTLHSFCVALFRIALFSCIAISFVFHVFFVLCFFHVALFLCCTLLILHFLFVAFFSYCIFPVLHSFHVAIFPCCTVYMLLFLLHSFHAELSSRFHVELFSCCTLFVLHCHAWIFQNRFSVENFVTIASFSYAMQNL